MNKGAIMAKIISKFLWDAHGWVILALGFAALAGWLVSLFTSAMGSGGIGRMIPPAVTFVGMLLLFVVVKSAFGGMIDILFGW